MKTFYRSLLGMVWIALLTNLVLAQGPGKDAPSDDSKGNLINILGAGDMVQAAADLRKAGESFERLGDSLEGITSTIAEGIVKSSKHHAIMSGTFDPFGFKTAFTIIQQQNQTIQALHKAEIERLRKECKGLKKQLSRLKRKMKKLKKGKE